MSKLVLKGRDILEKSGVPSVHQFGLRLRISATTATKYISAPEKVKAFDASILALIVTDGLGLTPEQALNLRLGDIFEIK